MALSLFCGGLGVAEASVHVNENTGGAYEVLTKQEVTEELKKKVSTEVADLKYAKASDVVTNTGNIATNKADITALQSELANKADATALDGKANTSLDNLSDAGKLVIKDIMSADMDLKANKAEVYSKTDADTTFATKTELNAKADTTALGEYAKTADVNNALNAKANKTDLDTANGKITDLQAKTAKLSADGTKLTGMTAVSGATVSGTKVNAGALKVTGQISDGTVNTTLAEIDASMKQTDTNKGDIANLQAKTNTQQTWIGRLKDKTTQISYDAAKGTTVNGVDFKAAEVDANGKGLTGVSTLNTTGAATIGGALTAAGVNAGTEAITGGSLSVTGAVTGSSVNAGSGEIKTTGAVNAGTLNTTGDATVGGDLNATGKVSGNGLDARTGAITGGSLSVTGAVKGSSVDAGSGEIKTTGVVNAGTLSTTGDATVGGDLNANGKVSGNGLDAKTGAITGGSLSVTGAVKGSSVDAGSGEIKTTGVVNAGTLSTTGDATVGGDLNANGKVSGNGLDAKTGAITGGSLSVTGAVKGSSVDAGSGEIKTTGAVNAGTLSTTGDATVGGDLKVTGTITTDKMVFGDPATNNYTEIDQGKVTSKNSVVNGEGQKITSSSIFNAEENKVGFANNATGDQSFHKQTSDVIMDNVKDRDNSNNRTQTKTETKDIITDKDGNSSTTSQTASENKTYLKDKDGKNTNSTIDTAKGYDKTIKGENGETSTKQDELNITNTAQNGTITNDAQNIVNNASGNITNKANTMDTTVTGKATESYGELETTVNGNETHTVTGNQDIHVTGKQTNTVVGGQENIISGGQTNNITGDQTTTITGNKKETVEGKVTENFKNGQETNVTGDQVIKVSGTQTTTATDIKRNASSGMIDTIDNDYGTNTETKVAGKTTTDVSIKGTGEEGKYIRGANESRDYLIKDTLKNSETKTVEKTSTEITDGNGKTSATIQDVNNLVGSVTNGTETGISGIHANDDGSVSIDSAVAGGGMSSVINQKKDSIQSAVGDGTNSTVIHQDKDNVTIASSNGMVGLVGKDIVNNAQDTITNTAGTSITNQVNDSKVTTDANGTTFENNTPAVSDGGATTTKINGNQITTGRVDANELGVSDKDGTNTADLSVKAGEGVKASASDGTTTGSLDVTADEVGSTVKDASGKGSTFKQRIDAIMMESKNVSIKAEETLTNEAKVITNKASEVIDNEAININNTATGIIKSKASEIQNQADRLISNKVGENTWENMEDGKITTSIKNGTKQNLTQSDAEKTEHSVVNGSNSTVNKQTSEEITDAVTNGTTTNVTQNTATSSNNTIADKNGNANTVISTADGTSFINSKAAAPVGDGTEVKTTIKGNTITTGKVTMDYAEVMKDLGVRGNANITGKTTTGSLEVTGTSTLKGNVTMESNATVKKDLTVEGNTNLKNTKVDGTLDVTQKATFGDSVSIAKDLSVDGNATIKGDVTAKSYKVGDKTYISAAGINANDQKITNVADGSISEGSKDAVNGGQLYTVKNDLEGKVNKVGANAAAMANLHPMEFDPDSKWNIAAAIGNYGSETAAALGAFYRPNDDVMVNLSTAFGTGENMVGGGVSVRLGKGGNKLSREETNALKAQVADLTARMDALLSVLNPNMSKDFPDVPENHWAYEAVSRLAGNDIVQGYPDGEFHGERTMTRYEMAEIIYNALSRGAEAEKELVEEFKPELQAMAASEKATAEKAEG